MKNKFKIITVILSCLLLIGAAVGIFVSAEGTDPSVSIYKKSVNYDGALGIHYAIDANLAEGQQVKVLFSYDEMAVPTGAIDESAYEKVGTIAANDEITINNVTYPLVYSPGIAPVDMTKPIYALPVIVDASNNVVATGDLDKFSIFDYCMERFSGTSTPDQYQLYKALLAYGASAQEVMLESGLYTEEQLDEYGYADAYYIVNATIKVDGEVASTEKVCYREADVTIEAPKTYGGTIFAGFEKDGEKVGAYGDNTASSWNYYDTTLKIGQNNFTYNYTSGSVYDWDNVTTLASNSQIFSPYNSSGVSLDAKSDTLLSAYTENGALVIDSPPLKENYIWDATSRLINTNNKTGAVGSVYVFETDFRIDFNPADYTNYDRAIGYLGMATGGYGGSDQTFVTFPIAWSSAKDNTYFFRLTDVNFGNTWDLAHLTFGEWYNIRIEYKITSLGTTNITPESSTATGTVSFYLNGELKSTHDVTGNSNGDSNKTFGIFGIQDQQGRFGNHNIYFDNTYIATED